MKPGRLRLVILMQMVLIAGLAGALVYLGRDEFKAHDQSSPSEVRPKEVVRASDQGTPIVAISNELRDGSGIEVAVVRPAVANSRKPLAGVVVSMQTLLEQASRWRTAQADDEAAQAEMRRARSEYERVSALYKDDRNASERALQAAEAAYQAARARASASSQAAEAQRARLKSEWGIDPTRVSSQLESLQSQRQVLLQIALEPGEQTAPALVWHAGRAWVYVKIPEAKKDDDEEFARRDVSAGEWQGEGWFTAALPANTEIVIRGAQLLLSEEQRGFIKNENDD